MNMSVGAGAKDDARADVPPEGSGSVTFESVLFYLNVTTACKVVLLPSSHPLGRIPGEPQLISK
jgi:hypothetical protein